MRINEHHGKCELTSSVNAAGGVSTWAPTHICSLVGFCRTKIWHARVVQSLSPELLRLRRLSRPPRLILLFCGPGGSWQTGLVSVSTLPALPPRCFLMPFYLAVSHNKILNALHSPFILERIVGTGHTGDCLSNNIQENSVLRYPKGVVSSCYAS